MIFHKATPIWVAFYLKSTKILPETGKMTHYSEDQPETIHDTPQEPSNELVCQVLNFKTDGAELIHLLGGLSATDWEAFRQAAHHQGVSLLVNQRLLAIKGEIDIPARVLDAWHQEVLTSATRNMLMLHEAKLILSALRAQTLEVIALKGLFLVEHVYSNISLRAFSDLDLMVSRNAIDQAIACLEGLGYAVETYYDSGDVNCDIKHVPPMSKPGGPYVEIHWTILEEDEPFTIDAMGLWQRSVLARVAGVDILALGVEDLLLHLCTHLGYQHHLNIGLRGLYDIALVLDHYQGQVDWQKLITIARQWGVERVVWLVFKLAGELLGAEVPQDVYEQLVVGNVPPDILSGARLQLLAGEGQPVQMTPDLAKLARSKGFLARLKVMLSRVFIPRQSLARLYNVSPRSLKIVGCYFRRTRDLWRNYRGAVRQVLVGDEATMAGAVGEERIEHLRSWMGKSS